VVRARVDRAVKYVRMRLPIQMWHGTWNLEFIEIFSYNRYLNFLSTVSLVPYLNPMDGWLSAVDILHKTLYVLKVHANSAKKIHSNRALECT